MDPRVDGPQTPYEVYCYSCRVSFPVGTKRCLHCGGPVGRGAERAVLQRALPRTHEQEVAEEELPTRSGRLSPIAIVWLVLALGGALYRACAGPS